MNSRWERSNMHPLVDLQLTMLHLKMWSIPVLKSNLLYPATWKQGEVGGSRVIGEKKGNVKSWHLFMKWFSFSASLVLLSLFHTCISHCLTVLSSVSCSQAVCLQMISAYLSGSHLPDYSCLWIPAFIFCQPVYFKTVPLRLILLLPLCLSIHLH